MTTVKVPCMLIELTKDTLSRQAANAEVAHRRADFIFSAASILLVVSPALVKLAFERDSLTLTPFSPGSWVWPASLIPIFLGLSFIAYILTAFFSLSASWPTMMHIYARPGSLLADYRNIDTDEGRGSYLARLEQYYDFNLNQIKAKYRSLKLALPLLGVETIFLVAAISSSLL